MNAYSIIHNYDSQPLYSPDFNFIQTALTYKQSKYDANKAKLQNLYSNLESLKVKKGVDQEYINNRLNQIYEITDRYAEMDLSDDMFVDQIMANTSQLFDENTKNAIISTHVMRAEDAAWDWYEKNQPEKFAKLNKQYAMSRSNREAYLNSDEVGEVYSGGAGFIEYRDVSKKIAEGMIKNADKFKDISFVQVGAGGGKFINNITKEEISKEKLSEYYDLLLDENDMEQLSINAWGAYDKVSDDVLRQDYNSMITEKSNAIDRQINYYSGLVNDNKYTQSEKDSFASAIDQLKIQKESLSGNDFDTFSNKYGRRSAYTSMYNQKFKEKTINLFHKVDYTKIAIDEASKEAVKLGWEMSKFETEMKYKYDKMAQDLDVAIMNNETKLATSSKSRSGNSKVSALDESGNPVMVETEIPTEEEKNSVGSIEYQAEARKDSFNLLDSTLAELGLNLNVDEKVELMKQITQSEHVNNVYNLNINGKEITLDFTGRPNLAKNLETASRQLYESDPANDQLMSDTKKVVDGMTHKLSVLASRGVRQDKVNSNLASFSYEIVEKDGGFSAVKINTSSNKFIELLKKKDTNPNDLTRAEKKTLELYTVNAMLSDSKMSGKSKVALEMYRDDLLAGVNNRSNVETIVSFDINKAAHWVKVNIDKLQKQNSNSKDGVNGSLKNISEVLKMFDKAEKAGYKNSNAFFKERIEKLKNKIERGESLDKNDLSFYSESFNVNQIIKALGGTESSGFNKSLTDFGSFDSEYKDKDGTIKSLAGGTKDILSDSSKSLSQAVASYENTIKQTYYNAPSQLDVRFTDKSKEYKTLKTIYGNVPDGSTIVVKRLYDKGGKYSETDFLMQVINKKGETVEVNDSKNHPKNGNMYTFKMSSLANNGLEIFGDITRTWYDANLHKAKTFTLHNNFNTNSYSGQTKDNYKAKMGSMYGNVTLGNKKVLASEYQNAVISKKLEENFNAEFITQDNYNKLKNEIEEANKLYESGNLVFSLVPDKATKSYIHTISTTIGGNRVVLKQDFENRYPSKIQYEAMSTLKDKNTAFIENDNLFAKYLEGIYRKYVN
jgi:hypothetical protein